EPYYHRCAVYGGYHYYAIRYYVEFAMICGYFLFFDKRVKYRVKHIFAKCSSVMPEYLSICIPVLISDTLLGLGNSAVGVVMGHIGETFVAANAITTVTVQLSTVFIQGMSNASAIITGHSLGEGLDLLCPKTGSDH
ncbi:MAG: hypothetical protein IKM59_04350, partial [Oscillospiraceae bacterium]|nr:hypothetical protein [Oscillospiraceae bacterium]